MGDERQPRVPPKRASRGADIFGHNRAKTGDRVGASTVASCGDCTYVDMLATPFLLNASPSQLLEAGGRELSPLLGPTARSRLQRGGAALLLPARTLCLECRLDDDERVDLALCLATQTAGLATALESLGQAYIDDPEWQRCIRLLLSWARSEERSLAAVPFLYTAFDLGMDAARMPVPCLSLCVDPGFFMRRLGLPVPRAPRYSALSLFDACRAILEADWLTASLRERVQHCLDAAIELEVRQLSLMLARRPASLKLDVTLSCSELGHFLVATGWRGNAAELEAELHMLAPWQRRVQLNYVVNAASGPAPLEVELCCTGLDEPTADERSSLLARLVARGLVRRAKAHALEELLRQPVVNDASGQWVARNWYLKLRFEGGRFGSAKAYIGLMQRSAGREPATLDQTAYGH